MEKVNVKIAKISENAVISKYATEGSAAFDLVAANEEPIFVFPNQSVVIPTGLKMEIPVGFKLTIKPRSGISLKTTLDVPNSPGTIDSDYRGEVGVILRNTAQVFKSGENMVWNIDGKPETVAAPKMKELGFRHGFPNSVVVIKKGDRIAQAEVERVIQVSFEEVTVEDLSTTERGEGGYGHTGTVVKQNG
jgi:dUTP pyrophosphatase